MTERVAYIDRFRIKHKIVATFISKNGTEEFVVGYDKEFTTSDGRRFVIRKGSNAIEER